MLFRQHKKHTDMLTVAPNLRSRGPAGHQVLVAVVVPVASAAAGRYFEDVLG